MVLFGLLSLVLMIVLPIVFVRRERQSRGGYISFGEVFKIAFIGLIIGGLLSTAFSMLYINLIDPEYPEKVLVKSLETQQRFMEGNMAQEQMEEIMRASEESTMAAFTPLGMLKSFFYIALFYVVISLIFAAFLKKNPPSVSTELDA